MLNFYNKFENVLCAKPAKPFRTTPPYIFWTPGTYERERAVYMSGSNMTSFMDQSYHPETNRTSYRPIIDQPWTNRTNQRPTRPAIDQS